MGLLQPADWESAMDYAGLWRRQKNLLRLCCAKEFNSSKNKIGHSIYNRTWFCKKRSWMVKRIGDAYLTPGWTSYNKHLQYQCYDVTGMLKNGANAIAVSLGDGWYRGNFLLIHRRNIYSSDISLLFQLDITYTDSTTASIISDGNWKSSTGAIRSMWYLFKTTIDANEESWLGIGRIWWFKMEQC